MDPIDEHHRYQSSDEEDFQEAVKKAVTLPKPIVLWRTQSPATPKKCSTLIIGSAFGGSSLLLTIEKKTLLGTIILPGIDLKDNTLDSNSRSNASCNIYELESDPSIIIIPCNYEIKDQDSLNFAKTIMNSIEATKIIILSTFSPSTYFTGSPDTDYNYPWLRLLKSTGSTVATKIPTLEVPNLVQNLGAAVMSYCEVRGLKDAYLLLSLEEHVYGKSLTTKATLRGLKDGLNSLGYPAVSSQLDESSAVVSIQDKRVGSNRTRDDRLYA